MSVERDVGCPLPGAKAHGFIALATLHVRRRFTFYSAKF